MWTYIEQYPTTGPPVDLGPLGRWDDLTLVEDDEGARWLVTVGRTVRMPVWAMASASGAAVIIVPGDRQGSYLAMATETFMSVRREERLADGPTYVTDEADWYHVDQKVTYYDVVRASQRSRTGFAVPQVPNGLQSPAQTATAPSSGLVHVHLHTEFSLLDGLAKVEEITEAIVAQGGTAAAVTDHGNVVAHPYWQKACDKAGIKPLFGCEIYLVDDRHLRLDQFLLPEGLDPKSDEGRELRAAFVDRLRDYWHIVLIAQNDVGLRNLWAISTEGFRDGLYGKNPRVDWDTLSRHSEGIIATSACLRGPLTHREALADGNFVNAAQRLARLLEIYGDRFYIEMHCNSLSQQHTVNVGLMEMAQAYRVPMIAAVDSHYARAEQKQAHKLWIAMQTNADIGDEEGDLFGGNQDYHLKTEAEVRADLAYLGPEAVEQCVANTSLLANRCTARIVAQPSVPIFSAQGGTEADVARLRALCESNWSLTQGKTHDEATYRERYEREMDLIVKKAFAGYYLMTAEQTGWAKDHGILVGPGRGSSGGSCVAYLARITDIDPVEANLLFERFMTEGRTSLPDFDVDYPQSKKVDIQQHVRDRYGEANALVVGSVIRLKNRGVIENVGRAMASTLSDDFYLDKKAMSEIIADAEGDTAGLGLSWDALWDKAGEELQPYLDKYPGLFKMAEILVTRVKSFGQHAAGMVITTDASLAQALPMRRNAEDGHLICQFDKDVLEDLGFVKFDLLTVRTLDTIQMAIDLIKERRGLVVDPYEWNEEYLDPQVWEELVEAHTLGVFQVETQLGTQYAKRLQPRSLWDLGDLVTIVRPGPRNSGLTETYLRRRDGLEQVTYPDPRMEQALSRTHGTLLYQEDIMQACMVLGGYDSTEADSIRKILGKKKVELVGAAGQEFVSRAVTRGMTPSDAAVLWSQMAEFSRYAFARAHAYAYAMLAWWCAWLRVHFPVEFLTAALSTVDKDRIPAFVKEARRLGLRVLPPDINESGFGFTPGVLSVRYGLDAMKGIDLAAKQIVAQQPFTSFEDFMTRVVEPSGSKVNRGHVATLARVGAFDTIVPNRRGLETVLLAEKTGEADRCVHKTDGSPSFVWISITPAKDGIPETQTPVTLPCQFDWAHEPPPINPRTGKKMKTKSPVKKCTKACRNYTAPPPTEPAEVEPYTDADIRDIEQEMLGVFLSSTPFDLLPEQDRANLLQQAENLDTGPDDLLHLIAGILIKKRPHTDSNNNEMGFIDLETEVGTVDCVVFSKVWAKHQRHLKTGALYVAQVERTRKGFTLDNILRIDN